LNEMLPERLSSLMAREVARNPLVARSAPMHLAAGEALLELGISLESEFAEFALNYRLDAIWGWVGAMRHFLDVCEPSKSILGATSALREGFEASDDYVCLTSIEGAEFIAYSRSSGSIYLAGLEDIAKLNDRTFPETWASFFEVMDIYVGNGAETGD
jgi:hypothetical protein